MSFGLATFTALLHWLAMGKLGYTFQAVLRQPVVMALPIGLIMGDLSSAMKIGAAINILYIGMVAAGSNLPADEGFAGVIAIPIAVQTGMDTAVAVTLAVPFGVLGVFLDQIRRTINAGFAHRADKHAADANIKGIWYCAVLYPLILTFFLRFPPVFIANLYGASVVEGFINVMPDWTLHGLSVVGGVLPALGFAITVLIIGKGKLIPFFIIGFFMVQYFAIDIMAAAIFGTCIALLVVLMKTGKGARSAT